MSLGIFSYVAVVQSLSRVQLCDPMGCSMPGSSVLHCLLEFAQIHVHCVGDAIQLSHPTVSSSVASFSSWPQSFPALGSFPMNRLFASESICNVLLFKRGDCRTQFSKSSLMLKWCTLDCNGNKGLLLHYLRSLFYLSSAFIPQG